MYTKSSGPSGGQSSVKNEELPQEFVDSFNWKDKLTRRKNTVWGVIPGVKLQPFQVVKYLIEMSKIGFEIDFSRRRRI